MPTVDQAWAMVHGPVQNLKQRAATESWPDNRAHFLQELNANDPLIADLILRLDGLSDDGRADLMIDDRLDAFVYQVFQEIADPNPTTGDDAAWGIFLATNVPAWDGSAESWLAFREWFLYYAAEAGFAPRATALLDYLEPRAPHERVTELAQHYGIVIAPPAAASSSAAAAVDRAAEVDSAWRALISRAPAHWDGEETSWSQFATAMLNAARAVGAEERAREFLREAESRDLVARFAYLSVYDLTRGVAAAPADLSGYTPTLYRLSGLPPNQVFAETGWGVNVYTAIFPTTITPTPDEIKTLLGMTSQQSIGSFLYRFPLAAATIATFKYMSAPAATIQAAIPAWVPTMRLVEVICTVTPDRGQIEVSVGGTWRLISSLLRRQ